MKIETKKLSSFQRELTVEVPKEIADKEYQKILEQYRSIAVVSGFRKGKVPANIIKARFSKEIEGDFYGKIIPDVLKEALKQEKLNPISEPSINDINFNPGDALKFTAVLEIKPEITVSGYKGVEIEKPEAEEVTEDKIEQVVTQLLNARASFESVTDRSVRKGDFALVNLWGSFTSGKKKNFFRDQNLMEVGGEGHPPGFNSHVLGMDQGKEIEFLALHPADDPNPVFGGEEVKYRVKVLEIKKKILPELDAAFAGEVAGCDTVEALKEKIRSDLEKMEESKVQQKIRDRIIEKIRNANPVEPPTFYVEKEIDARLQMLVTNIVDQGMDPAKLEIDWGELRKRFRPEAEKSASNALILEVIAGLENIDVSEKELLDEIATHTAGTDKSPEDTLAVLKKEGRLESVRNQLLSRKTIDFLAENAKITA